MPEKVMSKWEADNGFGTAVVKYSSKEEAFFIEYYDDVGHMFFTEDFPNKSIHYVEEAAHNWSIGLKKLG